VLYDIKPPAQGFISDRGSLAPLRSAAVAAPAALVAVTELTVAQLLLIAAEPGAIIRLPTSLTLGTFATISYRRAPLRLCAHGPAQRDCRVTTLDRHGGRPTFPGLTIRPLRYWGIARS
jgi:hypothetical protein